MREERLAFGTPPRVLEARLWEPDAAPHGGAVVCHPHPEYGGDMDVAVVVAVARAVVERGWSALRFNFGGVGRSGGRYAGGMEERRDAAGAATALASHLPPDAPLVLVGYSFGAWVATLAALEAPRLTGVVAIAPPLSHFAWGHLARLPVPLFVVAGDRDDFCPAEKLDGLERATGAPVVTTVLEGADHFFAGAEGRVAFAVCAHLGLA